jgi:hypothetical protein
MSNKLKELEEDREKEKNQNSEELIKFYFNLRSQLDTLANKVKNYETNAAVTTSYKSDMLS